MKRQRMLSFLWVVVLLMGITSAAAQETTSARIVFYVAWYDVGKAALEGLPGIIKVTSGWHRFREVNTVDYNPAAISPDQMVRALKDAGTYAGIAKWPHF